VLSSRGRLPRSQLTVYAACAVGRAAAALFHLGGASRVWLNGNLIHEDAAIHPSR
jgi:hypothetical protein